MRAPILSLSLLGLVIAAPAYAQTKAPTGLWLTENKRSAIELYRCAPDKPLLCGKIAWIIEGGMQVDTKNPDKAKRGAPLCGVTILSNLRMDSPGKWSGGTVYKADDGDIYDAKMNVLSEDKVELRGFVGISLLGKTQVWTRVSAKDYPPCKAPTGK